MQRRPIAFLVTAGGIAVAFIFDVVCQVAPQDVVSNLSKWIHALGFTAPHWLESQNADVIVKRCAYVVTIGFVLAFFYTLVSWFRDPRNSARASFRIDRVVVQKVNRADLRTGRLMGESQWVQLVPKCLTQSQVKTCSPHLAKIYKKINEGWEPIRCEPSPLWWSGGHEAAIDLNPTLERWIDVCYLEAGNAAALTLATPFVKSVRLTIPGEYRFDVTVTSEPCSPVNATVEVSVDEARQVKCELIRIP